MTLRRAAILVLFLAAFLREARAGLYYSGETFAELPSQWRGFLLDQRALRNIAVKPAFGVPANPLRTEYETAAARLEETRRQRRLKADELADLGALYVRLGAIDQAVELLRAAHREHPTDFRIAANLGTAWQLQGDLNQAVIALAEAVRLAPAKLQDLESYQLRLVRIRAKNGEQGLDDLFGVRYVNEKGEYEPGKLAAEQRKKMPAGASAIVQQLALWLPADGRLLWQLGELAGAHGDVKMSAAIFDGCVTEFGIHSPDLREHRRLARAAADKGTTTHEEHLGGLKTKSRRPLLGRLNLADLPPVKPDGVNGLPWPVLGETQLSREFKPTFPKYLKDLDGKTVTISGFMRPLGEDAEVGSFMLIEYPVGCWYCEVPDVTSILFVELPKGKAAGVNRGLVKITGTLSLNAIDPEDFLYTVRKAKIAEAD